MQNQRKRQRHNYNTLLNRECTKLHKNDMKTTQKQHRKTTCKRKRTHKTTQTTRPKTKHKNAPYKDAQGAQEPPERHLPTLSVGRHRQTGAGCARRSSDGPAPQSGPSTGEQRAHPARVGTHHEPRHSGRADQADPQRRRRTHRLSSSPQGRLGFFHD